MQCLGPAAHSGVYCRDFARPIHQQFFIIAFFELNQDTFPSQSFIENVRIAVFHPIKATQLEVRATAECAEPLHEHFIFLVLRLVVFARDFNGRCRARPRRRCHGGTGERGVWRRQTQRTSILRHDR